MKRLRKRLAAAGIVGIGLVARSGTCRPSGCGETCRTRSPSGTGAVGAPPSAARRRPRQRPPGRGHRAGPAPGAVQRIRRR